MAHAQQLTRRTMIGGLAAMAGGLALAGCGRSASEGGGQRRESEQAARQSPAPAAQLAAMQVYRDPNCGCCEKWAEVARQAGYKVSVTDHSDMAAIKRQYGVPDELLSCHTIIVGNYAVEGHVPLDAVQRLLDGRPSGIRGIAVAGMPRGSPGMEALDGSKDPFQVMAFDAAGRISPFRA
jgi:hypothetical protein